MKDFIEYDESQKCWKVYFVICYFNKGIEYLIHIRGEITNKV